MNWLAANGPNGIGSPPSSAGAKAKSSGKFIWPWEAHLIPNPILKVLSSIRAHGVRALLMGGQACVFYGAAEFSRDTDFAVLADATNVARLRRALAALEAKVIAVPPFELKYLRRGHAIHFRCRHPETLRMRVDIMSKMRGVDSFAKLWKRRTTFHAGGETYELLSLPDLAHSKKTQRDKDWPMLRRLVEANYFESRRRPTAAQIHFWLAELRTPELLMALAKKYRASANRLAAKRPLLRAAFKEDFSALQAALADEEATERERDRQYWLPLRRELEKLRHRR